MKHLLVIFSFLFLLSYQTTANSVIGKSIICKHKDNIKTVYAHFKSKDRWSKFYFRDYVIKSLEYTYTAELKQIILFDVGDIYYINRRDLSYVGSSALDRGVCVVFNSREELIEIMNNEIEQSKSQNKL